MTITPQDVAKLRTPADMVGLVPYLVGFTPQESLVVMCLRGPRKRSGLTVRIDLPGPEDDDALAHQMAARAQHDGASAVVLVCYVEGPDEDGDLPRRPMVDKLVASMLARSIEVAEVLLVRDGRWSSYACELACCPRGGTPIQAQVEGPVARLAAEAVLDGRAVLPDRAALRASVRPARSRLTQASLRQDYDMADAQLWDEDGVQHGVRDETLRLLRAAVASRVDGGPPLTLAETARIVLGLRDVEARDEAVTLWLDGNVDALLAVLTDLCRHAPDADAAPVCSVLAFTAYAQGDGALANVASERALDCEPGYTLAGLVQETLDRQVPPSGVQQTLRLVRRDLRERAASRVRQAKRKRRPR